MKQRDREAGYILVGVLLAITLLAVVGTSLVATSTNSIKISSKERDNQAAYYVAEAGLTYVVNELEQAVNDLLEQQAMADEEEVVAAIMGKYQAPIRYDAFEPVDQVQPYAVITVNQDPEEEAAFQLTSSGYIDEDERTVTQRLALQLEKEVIESGGEAVELPPFAVYTMGEIRIGNGTVTGDIASHSQEGIHFPGHTNVTINGDIFLPNGDAHLIKGMGLRSGSEVKVLEESSFPQMPVFPEIPKDLKTLPREVYNGYAFINGGRLLINSWQMDHAEWKLNQDAYFKEIIFSSNNTFTIDLGDQDRTIVVEKMNLNGHLRIKGSGRLTIYVTEELVPAQGSLGQIENINQINIFYAGKKALRISNNLEIYGSIFAKESDLFIGGGGQVHGNVFTNGKKVQMDGGSNIRAQLFFAPHADFTITAGGKVEGRVISNTFYSDGGANIILKEPFVLDGPISPQALGKGQVDGGSSGGAGHQPDPPSIIKTVDFLLSSVKEVQ